MKRIIFISMFVSLALLLTGCTIVKERYVREGPRPLPMRTYRRPPVPQRRYPIRDGREPYRLQRRSDHRVH